MVRCLQSSSDDDEFCLQPNTDVSWAIAHLPLAGNSLSPCPSENVLIFRPALESLTKCKISHRLLKTMVRVFLFPGFLLRNPCPFRFLVLFIWPWAPPTRFRSFSDVSVFAVFRDVTVSGMQPVSISCDRHAQHPFKLKIHICLFFFFFSVGKFSFFLWRFPHLFSLSVATIVRVLVFFSGTAFHGLRLRNLLLRSKPRGLYLSQKFPYLLERNQRSLHKEAGRLMGGGRWKYGLELASFSSITCLLSKTRSHLTAERETGLTPGDLVSSYHGVGEPSPFLGCCPLFCKRKCGRDYLPSPMKQQALLTRCRVKNLWEEGCETSQALVESGEMLLAGTSELAVLRFKMRWGVSLFPLCFLRQQSLQWQLQR